MTVNEEINNVPKPLSLSAARKRSSSDKIEKDVFII